MAPGKKPIKRVIDNLPDVHAKYFKDEDEVMLARAVVKVKQAPYPEITDTYHPVHFVACITHSHRLRRYSFKLRPVKNRGSELDTDFWFDLKLRRGVAPVFIKTSQNSMNTEFTFKGKKYWLGFDFVNPQNDREVFMHVLKKSSSGLQPFREQVDKKVIDKFVTQLRIKRTELKPGKKGKNNLYL